MSSSSVGYCNVRHTADPNAPEYDRKGYRFPHTVSKTRDYIAEQLFCVAGDIGREHYRTATTFDTQSKLIHSILTESNDSLPDESRVDIQELRKTAETALDAWLNWKQIHVPQVFTDARSYLKKAGDEEKRERLKTSWYDFVQTKPPTKTTVTCWCW